MPDHVAVVLAGGVGARMGTARPKQLIVLGGTTVLERTIAQLDAHGDVGRVVVMMAEGFVAEAREIASRYPSVTDVHPGGATRNQTTQRALELVGDDETRVLLHDAVRPLVSERIISDCFTALQTFEAVDVAIPSADTIIEVDRTSTITAIPPRSGLRRGQTPQAFRAGTLRRAYRLADQDPDFTATDDCGVVLRYCPEVPIHVVAGEERNLKITEPLDVLLAEQLLRLDDAGIRDRVAALAAARPQAHS